MSGTTGMKLSMTRRLILVAALLTPVVLAGCATSGGSLHVASGKGDLNAMEKVINAGADLNEHKGDWANLIDGWTYAGWGGPPLHHAAFHCQDKAAALLIAKGADVNARGGKNLTALHRAAFTNCKEVVRLLLDAGADINAMSGLRNWSSTPLGYAADQGHIQLVEYLIARGADIDVAIAGLNNSTEGTKKAKALLEEQRKQAVVKAARQAAQRQAEETQERIRKTLERGDLVGLLNVRPETGPQIEALTQALIRAKNTQIPGFIARSSVEERVNLLTTVELRISDAQALIARLNAQAEDAVRQGQSAAPLREEAGKVQTYAGILSAIRSMLLQS